MTAASLAPAAASLALVAARRRALRVLMYHRVGDHPERDAVPAGRLDRQLAWLARAGCRLVRLSDVVAHRERGTPLPDRAVLLTFDDGTVDHLEAALPVLRRHGAPAAFFVSPGLAGQEVEYGDRRVRTLGVEGLRALAAGGAELGIHSWSHANLAELPGHAAAEDARRALAFFADRGIPVAPALAYPYGAYPRTGAERDAFFAGLAAAGVRVAFRIGNRVNRLPLESPFEIRRIGLRSSDGPWSFAAKVAFGRVRPFA